jgi:hypothetical protein
MTRTVEIEYGFPESPFVAARAFRIALKMLKVRSLSSTLCGPCAAGRDVGIRHKLVHDVLYQSSHQSFVRYFSPLQPENPYQSRYPSPKTSLQPLQRR